MRSTFQGFTAALSGMQTYQMALNTTAHNIANIATPGFSKQTVNTTATTYGSFSSKIVGSGVMVTDISITRNDYYDVKFRNANTMSAAYQTKSYYLDCIQDYSYALEADTGSVTNSLNEFSNALIGLTDTTSDTMLKQLVSFGSTFTSYVNELAEGLQKIQKEANAEIKTTVDKINALTKQVASITEQINKLENFGKTANDLRDQRNLLVDELSTYMLVEVVDKPPADGVGFNQYVIYANGGILLDGINSNEIKLTQRENKDNINDINGLYELEWRTGEVFPTNVKGTGGSLQALFDVRDGNNEEALKGKLQPIVTDAVSGKTIVTIEGTNINDVNKLNIPASDGVVTICGREYAYSSFDVSVVNGEFTYSFVLKKDMNTDQQDILNDMIAKGSTATIGRDIDFRGIPYYMAQMNEFVRTYSEHFNRIQNEGYDYHGNPGVDFFNANNPLDGSNYVFNEKINNVDADFSSLVKKDANGNSIGSYYYMTCLNFTVSKELVDDPKKIGYKGASVNGSGDNTNANRLAKVKDDSKMFLHGAPVSFFVSLTSTLGVDARKVESLAASQENILYAVEFKRLSISGVDEDEEAKDLMKFQSLLMNQYKVLSVMNEVISKLINDTGVG